MTAFADLFERQSPAVPLRAVHLDLKGLPPTPSRLMQLLDLFQQTRYNAILVEWEDTFPWTCDARFRGETCYTPQQVRAFHDAAERRGIEIIPLVQCVGHLETVLQVDDYRHLREQPRRTDCLNPLAPGAREVIERLIDDVLAATPGARWFHLGGDEAWIFGTHPDTKRYIAEQGPAALYLHHVQPLLDRLSARGVRPILWHDMMKRWPDEAMRTLARSADLMVWGYRGTPDATDHHHARATIERLLGAGLTLWGAGAFKGSDAPDHDLPDPAKREENMLGWAHACGEFGLVGVCATGWSRNSTSNLQRAPLDATLDLLVQAAVNLHDAKPCAIDRCAAALDAIGEGEAFRRRRAAIGDLQRGCDSCWRFIRNLRTCLAGLEADASRRPGAAELLLLDVLEREVRFTRRAGEAVRAAFEGVVEPIWIDRLVDARLIAIDAETQPLAELCRRLSPCSPAALAASRV